MGRFYVNFSITFSQFRTCNTNVIKICMVTFIEVLLNSRHLGINIAPKVVVAVENQLCNDKVQWHQFSLSPNDTSISNL